MESGLTWSNSGKIVWSNVVVVVVVVVVVTAAAAVAAIFSYCVFVVGFVTFCWITASQMIG